MADISWIKLSVNLFDDEKIKVIKSLPDGSEILLIWIQLLCLAGKTNDGGQVYIGQNMYYTDEMLATVCGQPIQTIRLAIQTFVNFGMIEANSEGLIVIENWEKHQNIEGMDKIREQNRLRKQKQREKEKMMLCDSHVTVTQGHATEEEKNKNKIKNKNNIINNDSVMKLWNSIDNNIPKINSLNPGTNRYNNLRARVNEYGAEEVLRAIENIKDSQFLKGYTSDFTINFDWFVKPNNFIKVLEGNYNDKKTVTKTNNNYKDYINEKLKNAEFTPRREHE